MNVAHLRHAPPFVTIGLSFAIAFASPRLARALEGRGDSCERHREHGSEHHGARHGIHHLLEGVEIRADQREALIKLHRAAMDDREVVQGITKAYRSELARQVRAGAVDEASLEKLRQEAAAELAVLPPVRVGMLARLHGLLDNSQRAQVAKKLAKTPPGDPDHETPVEANEDQGRSRQHGVHGQERGPALHRLQRFAEELELAPAQRQAIFKAFHDRMKSDGARAEYQAMRAEMEKRHHALAARFRADTFAVTDADNLPAERASDRIARMSRLAVIATPSLTVNQRIRLAEKIEAGRQNDEP